MDNDAATLRASVAFGPFRLHPAKRLLEKAGAPVAVGGRALDILVALTERAGDVVGKSELMDRVWPSITVDESSLRTHVAALRKALGDGQGDARYVTNVPGRGYCFVAPLTRLDDALPTAAGPHPAVSVEREMARASSPELAPGLPPPLSRMIGREAIVRDVIERLAAQRFVTLHGPGGIGKTTVALAVAHAELASFANVVVFVDLGAITDQALVTSAVASALGVAVQSDDPSPSLVNRLRRQRTLLVLDSCEQVIDAVARLAERIWREAPEATLLTTSREPLRVEGEHVYPLLALATPPQDDTLAATEVLSFPAVHLFVERAAASGHPLDLSGTDAMVVANICRKLDGNALAIELAAGRVGTHGLHELAALLDSRLRLLWPGRRTALPRHQTLSATLDWSYSLIAEVERTVLRRLSVFVGGFTLQAAQAVVVDDSLDDGTMVEALEQLVAKSLVQATPGDAWQHYRLLDTTRTYARAKLADSGEERAVAARHATHFGAFLDRTRVERTQATAATGDRGGGRIERAALLGNVRAALDWCFSATGDGPLGVRFAAAAAPLLIELSLLEECRRWTERALSAMTQRGTPFEMELQAALGHSLMLTSSNSNEAQAALERGLAIAADLGDLFNQFRILNRLHLYYRRIGDVGRTLVVARRMEAVAAEIGDPVGKAGAHSMLGLALHLAGHQVQARAHLEAASGLAGDLRPTDPGHFAFHRAPRIAISRVLWLQGFADQAIEVAAQLARAPLADDDPITSCIALIWCASVNGWAGDLATVEALAEKLIAHAGAHALVPYQYVGLGIRAEVMIQRGQHQAGIALLRRSIASLEADRYRLYTPGFVATLAQGLAAIGHHAEAIREIDEEIAGVETLGGKFILPELLRVRGDLCAATAGASQAESFYQRGWDLAGEQAALAWRLRVAMSQYRLDAGADAARQRLADTYAQFSEGFATADLMAARAMLAQATTLKPLRPRRARQPGEAGQRQQRRQRAEGDDVPGAEAFEDQ